VSRLIDTSRVLCTLAELGDDGCRGFTLGAGDWPLRGLVLRSPAGPRAFVNHCPHAGHRLDLRPHRFLTPDGSLIVCASHGALFEREGGLCIAGPCAGQRLTPVPLRVEGDYVLLADEADPAALAATVERG
jgi:nitrite reductase/ring-hydroxylating ferredoxin subunit